MTLAVVSAILGLIKLGIWQLGRAEEKTELQQSVSQSSTDQALAIVDTLAPGDAIKFLPQQNQLLSVQGEFQNQHILFLVFQTHQDQLGYEVLIPMQIPESSRWVLVSRGWVSPTIAQHPDQLPLLQGSQTIKGNAFIPAADTRMNNIQNPSWPLQIRFQNISELEALLQKPLFPFVVRLAEDSPGVLIRHWPYVMPDTVQHISYAIQWFAMAAAVLILSLVGSSNAVALIRKRMEKSEQELRNL